MKYGEIKVGDKATLQHKITQNDIEKFVDLTGDDNKLHIDKDYAARTSFKKPVVHGMLGASFISTIIGTKLPGDGALWFSQTLEFLLPVRVGDEITVRAEVIKKNDRENIIELNVEILNQNRQVVTRGVSKVKVIDQVEPEKIKENIDENTPRVALVLGATGGIGEATAMRLAMDGCDIVLHYNSNKQKAGDIAKEIEKLGRKAVICQADILNAEQVEQIVATGTRKLGKIDIVVNCAASAIPPIKVGEMLWTDILHQIEINIKANLVLVQSVLPQMLDRKWGKIVTIGTVYSDKPNPDLLHYITAKSALEGFTKSLAFELAPKGINVNMVSPSVISTELTADIPEKIKLMTAAQTPVRRLALPADVAAAVAYLVSDGASFLAGENIRLNGGQVMF